MSRAPNVGGFRLPTMINLKQIEFFFVQVWEALIESQNLHGFIVDVFCSFDSEILHERVCVSV